MQTMPHHYTVSANSESDSTVNLEADGLSAIESMPPPEFGGPEGYWSPESLLVASMADCFVLTFKAIARASKLEWTNISCEVVGTLGQVDRVTQFTQFELKVTVDVPSGTDSEKVERIAEKSEKGCLVSNSLTANKVLNVVVNV
ncbi:osmotically inducible protein OsmC [Oleiphilus sp. HI0125]|uniref:OsmC family protein n=1 Tax=Oleiphilus sp. HI0125 TaxID=1822266 RepID=UPI0007C3D806|nr:OsmC family protein [Oleiphilus sp. HI0125]KZZ59844.1 osmotically inducible protein OsmC [Oleiphilus sp. HI0125]